MRRVSIPETRNTKALVVALCTYETAAITTGRVPTLTALHRRWPVVGLALVGALVVHFWAPESVIDPLA